MLFLIGVAIGFCGLPLLVILVAAWTHLQGQGIDDPWDYYDAGDPEDPLQEYR